VAAPVVQQQPPGLMARMRAAVGIRKLEDVVDVDRGAKPLGKGTFGTVFRGQLKNGHKVAVKVIEKGTLRKLRLSSSIVSTECEMMRECTGRDNFVQLYDIVETDSRYCLLLELCDGGNVQDGAVAAEGLLGEKQVRFLMKQMLESINFLHSKNICHRDIKPHNYLLVGDIRSAAVKVKLGDFGTTLRLERGKLLKEQVGTPAFMAPELHLLPNKSSGYDSKVDVWAVGVCMIFLLANEYPFIDGSGKLLRHRIIQGDVPLWEANAFQSLFQGAQEALGLVKKRPSKLARELTRLLLNPNRQKRVSAWNALQHDWFTQPIVESNGLEDVTDQLPILDMKEFENAFSLMERDFGVALDALSKVEMGTVEEVRVFEPGDDRMQNCVVCYGKAGDFGHVCPQCFYAVCIGCLQKMPKPVCPHCRCEATEMAVAHAAAHMYITGSRETSKIIESVGSLASMHIESVGSLASMPVNVDFGIDISDPAPVVCQDHHRRQACFRCQKPASSTNYVCPSCCMTMCFECTKDVLVARPRCPACGEVERVAATVPQYIAATEAWVSATELGNAVVRNISDMTRRWSSFSNGSEQSGPSTPAAGHTSRPSRSRCYSDEPRPQPPHSSVGGHFQERQERHSRTNACSMCQVQAAMFDHVCPCCNAAVCNRCICTRLPEEDLHCPVCKDRASNAPGMRLIANSLKGSNGWSSFWKGIFGDGSAQPGAQPALSLLHPTRACQQVPTEDQHQVTLRPMSY
jgi:serine/threonine protein kinase